MPWRPGESGNPAGKRPGCTHRATRAVLEMLGGDAEALARKVIDLALAGDPVALRLCLERLVPVRKMAPIQVELPPIESAKDAKAAVATVLRLQCAGELTADEAEGLLKTIGEFVKVSQLEELQERVERLEIIRTFVESPAAAEA